MCLVSQEMRKLAPELDPLRIGTGWKKEDLGKVQVMVESTYGDSHPGSGHLNILVEEVRKGVAEEGGFGARYYCTDICDGESQGTDGINYSLASREMIANMIEIHANATPFDAGVYLSSCDKGVPGNLMGLARVNIPSVFVPGGTMNAGPEMLTLEQLGMYSAQYERGEIDEEKLDWAKCNACPSCGACSFIGTASTMQIMAEALGLALPGTALMPATSPDLLDFAREAGRQAVRIAQMENMRPSDIVTMDSFENAINKLHITPYDFVVVITRGHRHDANCLRALFQQREPAYLGMIGSRRRVRGLLDMLKEEGLDEERLGRICTPIGLAIGAVSPAEIAISILSQVIEYKRLHGGMNRAINTSDLDLSVVEQLMQVQEPVALVTVVETKGSTPRGMGAMMYVYPDGRIVGSIGGGCSEAAILRDALDIIGTGTYKVIDIDMTGDVAESEGMVCGGIMKVLVEDIPLDVYDD